MVRGAPDFQQRVFLVRGGTYPEFRPRADETLKIFLLVFNDASPLPPGVPIHLVDLATNLPMPYTSAKGYYLDFREWLLMFDGIARLEVTVDTIPTAYFYGGINETVHTYEQIVFVDTRYWDPGAASTHTIDCVIKNISDDAITGSVQVALAITKIGSGGEKKWKTVRCWKCGNTTKLPIRDTQWKCPNCHNDNIYPLFGLIGDAFV